MATVFAGVLGGFCTSFTKLNGLFPLSSAMAAGLAIVFEVLFTASDLAMGVFAPRGFGAAGVLGGLTPDFGGALATTGAGGVVSFARSERSSQIPNKYIGGL